MLVVRYEPGASGRFCSTIIQNLISEHHSRVDSYGGMHNESELPDVVQSHDRIEDIIDLFDHVVQIIIKPKDLPLVCQHFYYSCIKRWWDTKLLRMYHPDLDKKDLLKILMNKHISSDTLHSMIKHHKQYGYAFEKYPNEKIIPISLDCLLNGDPVEELINYFPTDKDLSSLNNMVQEYQQKHKKIY